MKFTESTFHVLVSLDAAERSAHLHPLAKKLRAFADLPVGWSHGEGRPVDREAIRVAEEFVEVATRLQLRADVFPGLGGDCAVAFYEGQKSVEVIVSPGRQDRFGLHVEEGQGFRFNTLVEKEDASQAEVVRQITQLVTDAWKSHASSRYVSSTQTGAAFQTWFSSTRPVSLLEPQTIN